MISKVGYMVKINGQMFGIQAKHDEQNDTIIFPRSAIEHMIFQMGGNRVEIVDKNSPIKSPDYAQGRWIDKEEKDEWYDEVFECSLCKETMLGASNFCPKCGAKMINAETD